VKKEEGKGMEREEKSRKCEGRQGQGSGGMGWCLGVGIERL